MSLFLLITGFLKIRSPSKNPSLLNVRHDFYWFSKYDLIRSSYPAIQSAPFVPTSRARPRFCKCGYAQFAITHDLPLHRVHDGKTTWLFQRFPRLRDSFFPFAFLREDRNICTCRVPLQSPRSYSCPFASERTFSKVYAWHKFSCLRLRRKKSERLLTDYSRACTKCFKGIALSRCFNYMIHTYIFSYQGFNRKLN